MVVTNYSAARDNLKSFCDKASEGEIVLITRKGNKNVMIISLDDYNEMEKKIRNAKYIDKIDRGFDQIKAGKGKYHDLIEVDEDE